MDKIKLQAALRSTFYTKTRQKSKSQLATENFFFFGSGKRIHKTTKKNGEAKQKARQPQQTGNKKLQKQALYISSSHIYTFCHTQS